MSDSRITKRAKIDSFEADPATALPPQNMTATTRALGVPELLEQMLLGLSLEQLFTVQRVSKDWQAQIKGSIHLQRKMLLAYDDPKEEGREFGLHYLLDPNSVALPSHPLLPCEGCLSPDPEGRKLQDERLKDSKQELSLQLILRTGRSRYQSLASDHYDGWTGLGCDCAVLKMSEEEISSIRDRMSNTASRGSISSWRDMKLSNQPRPVRLSLEVWPDWPDKAKDYYQATAFLDQYKGTVGGAFDFLTTVIERDIDEHSDMMHGYHAADELHEEAFVTWENSGIMGSQDGKALLKARKEHAGLADCGKSNGLCHHCTAKDGVMQWYSDDWVKFEAALKSLEESLT